MAAKIAGASQIIGIDINERKFPLALELGCTHVVSALAADAVKAIRDIADGGVDFSFEISGNEVAMATAYAITRNGGEIVAVGLGSMDDLYPYPHTALVTQEKVIRGSALGSGVVERDIPRYVRMYLDGKLPLERLKSANIGFDSLNESLDSLDRGDVVRQILLPHG
jgi:alcohol dehydrogenase